MIQNLYTLVVSADFANFRRSINLPLVHTAFSSALQAG